MDYGRYRLNICKEFGNDDRLKSRNNNLTWIYPNETAIKNKLEEEIKSEILKKYMNLLNKTIFSEEDKNEVRKFIKDDFLAGKYYFASNDDRRTFVEGIINGIFGMGILEGYIKDSSIEEIWVLAPDQIWIKQNKQKKLTDLKFKNDNDIVAIINKILAPINRRADEIERKVDARLLDGSRVAITMPKTSPHPQIVIRKFVAGDRRLSDYVANQEMTKEMADFLETSVRWGANMIISGSTGSGKTTLLNALAKFIPLDEHIITIEDTLELEITNPFLQTWEIQKSNNEGKFGDTASELVKHSLRNTPDRIILGEIRDNVAYNVLDASMTGHKGTLTTIHSETPFKAIERFCTYGGGDGTPIDYDQCKKMFPEGFDIIIQIERVKVQGVEKRIITNITLVVGYGKEGYEKIFGKCKDENSLKNDERTKVWLQDIFYYDKLEEAYVCKGFKEVFNNLIKKARQNNDDYDIQIFEAKKTKIVGMKIED